MDTILANASQLNPVLLATDEDEYDGVARDVLQALKKIQMNDANKILEVLEQLDASTLTIPYFYLLHGLLEILSPSNKPTSRSVHPALLPGGKAWAVITEGLLNFDPIQIRYVGHQLSRIVEVVYYGAEQSSNFVPAIQVLHSVILELDPTSSTLTVTHYYFVQACSYARAYVDAASILDRPIYHVPTSESMKPLEKRLAKNFCSAHESSLAYINPQSGLSGRITYRTYLEYYLLGALCYIGSSQWRKAKAFLEVVLATPTQQNAASMLMVEAYRRWVLLCLIIDGESQQPPRAISANVLRHVRTIAKPYECIADAFKTNNYDTLTAEVQEGLDQWTNDANYGLMSEVLRAFSKFSVVRLGKIFAALPIEELARRVSPTPENMPGFLAYIQELISTGDLKAEITSAEGDSLGTVRFLPPSAAQKPEPQIEQELAVKARELQDLLRHVANYDHQLEVSKDYLDWLQKAKKARDQEKKGNVPVKVPGLSTGDVDEDMMVDY
ncbi:hypothetical protein LTR05_007331 [Lithohypha guttulata]|uniref:COP9 signalosome complex subunit 3 N-terminal helical repeats domain-containing protein n=1 Tax=Lithohypha guttulata TaxID=1690604 RepID=A0AAN7SV54_9EURO|nr:hypothetical protein LTR05_007331 [Lithohypha guttulata]